MDPLLSVSGLTRRFGGLTALEQLTFSVEKGTIYSIIGPNGAGKSTLFNCICGLYRPDAGVVRFAGEEITGRKPHQIARRGIGRTFQNLELFRHMTTMENLMLGRHLHMKSGIWSGITMFHRRSRAAREEVEHREEVERIIDLLGLHAARDRYIWQLPYGTQKLVELGRALATRPALLLLDEPAAGMNFEERQDLLFWIADIRDELGVTIVMIEHNMQMVMGISDRVLALDFGRAISEGAPSEVSEHPEVVRAYLG
jgi:branched-chain amino acid transport system ATP-binding protein